MIAKPRVQPYGGGKFPAALVGSRAFLSLGGTMADIVSGTYASRAPREAWNADARFYLTMVLVSTAVIVIGFTPSFYLKSVLHAPPPLSLLTFTHGIVFTLWLALFVTQASLIANGNGALHRRLGVIGALLFGMMITLGFWTAITAARLGHVPPGAPEPLAFLALPLIALASAALLLALALWNRQQVAWHKRLMVASLFLMTGPGSGRIAIPLGLADTSLQISMFLADLLLLVCIVYDWRQRGTVHPAYWLAAVVFAVQHIAITWAFTSPPAWMGFAQAITA
jgi:hypothetical protein